MATAPMALAGLAQAPFDPALALGEPEFSFRSPGKPADDPAQPQLQRLAGPLQRVLRSTPAPATAKAGP